MNKDKQEKDRQLLQKISEKNEKNGAVALLGRQLSPSLVYLRDSPYEAPEIAQSETYFRSSFNPLTGKTQFLYSEHKKALSMGFNSHLGNYQNKMQHAGDSYQPSDKRKQTSDGSSELFDLLLEYRKSMCMRVQTMCLRKKASSVKTKYLKIIYANQYPCIMVHISKDSVFKPVGVKSITEASHKAWVEFLISMFTGMVNYYAYKNNIHIELERRSGFGFLTPSICETDESFRINMGIVPRCYADLLVDALFNLDDLIQKLHKHTLDMPAEIFYGSRAHVAYLGKRVVPLRNLLHILFVPIEKKSGLGVLHITRTAYARQGLAMTMFNTLLEGGSAIEGFCAALSWAVQRPEIVENSLKFNSSDIIKYNATFKTNANYIKDSKFWGVVEATLTSITKIQKPTLLKQIETVRLENIADRQLTGLYYNLELLNELIFSVALTAVSSEVPDDGHGSDSECEGEVEDQLVCAKKIITHNGMRAIWCALVVAANYLAEQRMANTVYCKTAYYEVEVGLKRLIEDDLQKIIGVQANQEISIASVPSEASILIHDINACVTHGEIKPDYTLSNKNKIIILDTTSATIAQVNEHIRIFAASRAAALFLVDSGFKHQQLGADKNQYGTVRVFTKHEISKKAKELRDRLYADMAKQEMGIFSMTSHILRRTYKKIGATPTTSKYLTCKMGSN